LSENIPTKKPLIRFIFNPTVILIGWTASVFGVLLSVYLYYAAKEYRQLTYYVNPVKAVWLKAGQDSRLTASYDEKLIDTDITAIQIAIWNEGKLAIRKDNILKDNKIIIYTEKNTPILDATIRKTSRDVIGTSLDKRELGQGRLIVSWNILEHQDGNVIQLIYAGNPEINIYVDGVIEGQKQVEQLKYSGKIMSAEEQFYSWKRKNMIYGFIFLGMGIIFLPFSIFIILGADRMSKNKVSIKQFLEKFERLQNENLPAEISEKLKGLRDEYQEVFNRFNTNKGQKYLNSKFSRRIILIVIILFSCIYFAVGIYTLFTTREAGSPFGF
jgi:hypothetical protein